ncbi:Phenylcoumaran benzylic ether reductase Betv6 [Linum perenne]
MAEKSKILIIGGTGYIGKFIVEASLKAGDLYDHESLVKAIKQADVVISTVGSMQLADQTKIISAIKEAGNVKVSESPAFYHHIRGSFSVLGQPGLTSPPRDKITILGDGNTKEDPRTLNKTLLIKPPKNIYSINELVALWEKKIGKTLEKTYVPEDQLLKTIQESPIPLNIILSISHSVFVKGDQTNFDIEPAWGVEASELYPDVKYTTVEEYLSQFI